MLLDQIVGAAGNSNGSSPSPACLAAAIRLVACDNASPYALNTTYLRTDQCFDGAPGDQTGFGLGGAVRAELLSTERSMLWSRSS